MMLASFVRRFNVLLGQQSQSVRCSLTSTVSSQLFNKVKSTSLYLHRHVGIRSFTEDTSQFIQNKDEGNDDNKDVQQQSIHPLDNATLVRHYEGDHEQDNESMKKEKSKIEHKQTKKSKKKENKKTTIYTDPVVTEASLKNVQRVCAMVFGYNCLYAATMGRDLTLHDIVKLDTSAYVMHARAVPEMRRMIKSLLLPALPASDIYVMEKQRYVYKSSKGLDKQINMQLVECALKILLMEKADSSLYYEATPQLINHTFQLLRDGDRLPCETVVREVFEGDIKDTGLSISPDVFANYDQMKKVDKEIMGSCILLAGAFWKHAFEILMNPW